MIVDVPKPIIGANFLRHFALQVDMKHKRLWDSTTQLQVQGIVSQYTPLSPIVTPIVADDPFTSLLSEFPTISQAFSPEREVKHGVSHHIDTKGPPVAASRRLALDRLSVAKQEFDHMLALGIIRPSSSSWSSPLHLVPKKSPGDCRPVVTIPRSQSHHRARLISYPTSMTSRPVSEVAQFSPNWT